MDTEEIKIVFEVSYTDVKNLNFRTVVSPYNFTLRRRIYYAEFLKIEEAFQIYGIRPFEVTDFAYISGLYKPYELSDAMVCIPYNLYRIEIRAKIRKEPARVLAEARSQISILFSSAKSTDHAKMIYRKLMVKYHPDKEGGNEELTKYINSFKYWK